MTLAITARRRARPVRRPVTISVGLTHRRALSTVVLLAAGLAFGLVVLLLWLALTLVVAALTGGNVRQRLGLTLRALLMSRRRGGRRGRWPVLCMEITRARRWCGPDRPGRRSVAWLSSTSRSPGGSGGASRGSAQGPRPSCAASPAPR